MPQSGQCEDPVWRFFRNIRIRTGGCWIWVGSKSGKSPHEYGGFREENRRNRKRRTVVAHRWAYVNIRGIKVSRRHELHHFVCKNSLCANPWHVTPLTPLQHAIAEDRPRSRVAIKCERGHEFSKSNTRVVKLGGRRLRICKECARIRQRKYVANNIESVKERMSEWYKKNRAITRKQ